MTYELTSSMDKDVLEITISGEGNKENRGEIAMKVVDLVRRSKPRCVLIDLRSIRGPLSILETFDLVRGYPNGTPHIRAAVVDREENKRQLDFYETVAVNVGYSTQYFTDMDAARTWLNS
jgi:hypothetical protein